jgi:diguanylate cyclase (GGDEF)-like protein
VKFLVEKNLIKLIAYGPFFFIPFVVILISTVVIYHNQQRYQNSIEDIERIFVETQKNIIMSKIDSSIKLIEYQHSMTDKMLQEKVKSRVDTAFSVAKNIYAQNKNTHNPEEIRKMIIDSLRPLVWNGGESSLFILDFDGFFYLAPEYLRHLEGSSIIDFQDAAKRYVIREEIELVKKSGSGYLWDTFTRPNYDPKRQFKQLVYVKNFGKYNWYIGSAEYLDTSIKEIEKTTLDIINNSAVGESEYFFVIDQSGNLISEGKNYNLIGKNVLQIQDSDGKYLIKEIIKSALSKDPNWVSYKWKNPASNQIELKYTYAKKVPNSNWIIGSGFYMEEVNRKIAEQKNELSNMNKKQFKNILSLSIAILLISLVITYLISKSIQKRFFDYSRMIEIKNEELTALNTGLENIVNERTSELNEAYEKMEKIALTDTLTNIYNRYYFNSALQNEISRAKRYEGFSLLMFDIDHFKEVNDTFGHDVGDRVLQTIAERVGLCLRESDIFARVGGEEFMVILPQTTLETANEIGERIRQNIEEYNFETIGKATVSLGLVDYRENESFVEILKRVDTALYKAKNNGRNILITEG